MMQFRFVGCGDAFGSGGRFNTCFHVTGENANFLIDCGASSLIALKKQNISLNDIQVILITHFHADHFGGIPPFMLDAQFFSKRQSPLIIAGPKQLGSWFIDAMEIAFPGSSKTSPKFPLTLLELEERKAHSIGSLQVTPYGVNHGNPGGPFFAYRIECNGRTIAYSGDTEWTENLIDAAHDADLFIAESYFREKKVPLHLDLATLEKNLDRIRPKRLILTHMSQDMLAQIDNIDFECAEDGMVVKL